MTNTTLEKETQKEIAQALFAGGMTHQTIAEKIKVSRQTVYRWIKEGCWAERRAAKTASRGEIVAKMLNKLDQKVSSDEWSADEIAKTTAAIERIDKKTNIVTVMEVFSLYDQWLATKMANDPELTPVFFKMTNKYQDLFVGDKLGNIHINEDE